MKRGVFCRYAWLVHLAVLLIGCGGSTVTPTKTPVASLCSQTPTGWIVSCETIDTRLDLDRAVPTNHAWGYILAMDVGSRDRTLPAGGVITVAAHRNAETVPSPYAGRRIRYNGSIILSVTQADASIIFIGYAEKMGNEGTLPALAMVQDLDQEGGTSWINVRNLTPFELAPPPPDKHLSQSDFTALEPFFFSSLKTSALSDLNTQRGSHVVRPGTFSCASDVHSKSETATTVILTFQVRCQEQVTNTPQT